MKIKPKLKFMLDYGTSPLWSNDEFTRQKFDYHIDNLKDLGLSDKTVELAALVTELYYEGLNPIYQMLPSFWSGEMCLFFQIKLRQLFKSIMIEIGDFYEIENKEEDELNKTIDVQKINFQLEQFLQDPGSYYRANNISFISGDEKAKLQVDLEFKKWKLKELTLLELL